LKVLITGITGFAGSHLAEFCLDQGAEVFGSIRWRSRKENIESFEDQVHLIECDLKDYVSVRDLLKAVRPDYIFHLAAQSFVPTSWHCPQETLTNNVIGELNILEAVRDLGINPMIQVAGSSEEYGLILPHEVPVKETNPLRPLSPYAVSKVAQDLLGFQYFQSYGLNIVRTRAFNHTGPRRGEVFACSNFARQIVEIEKGLKEPVIRVGNLNARRDFSDVRDVVRAYWLSLERGEPGEVYNISSGRAITIKELLDQLLSLSEIDLEVKEDPERMRPSDVEILVGDCSKFKERTGWEPRIPLETTLKDLLDYWRERVGKRQ
jgi:GDP-4-dehydro-6-deoxy-D-mannose reductase